MTWDQANNLYGCLTIAAESIGVIVAIWTCPVMLKAGYQLAAGSWEPDETLSESYALATDWRR